jgi:hypothetical protein
VNVATREMLRRRLEEIEVQLEVLGEEGSQDTAKSRRQKEMLKQRKTETEKLLASQEDANEVVNRIVPLDDEIPTDTECEKILDPYLSKISQAVSASVSAAQAPSDSSVAE